MFLSVLPLLIENDTAVELALFTNQEHAPSPEASRPFFKGRTMVVYVRYKESPTCWVSIRQIIQPAND